MKENGDNTRIRITERIAKSKTSVIRRNALSFPHHILYRDVDFIIIDQCDSSIIIL